MENYHATYFLSISLMLFNTVMKDTCSGVALNFILFSSLVGRRKQNLHKIDMRIKSDKTL